MTIIPNMFISYDLLAGVCGIVPKVARCKQYMSDSAFPVELFYMDAPALDRLPSQLPMSSLPAWSVWGNVGILLTFSFLFFQTYF